jgi:DNA-binding NtrC family response regulator
MDAQSVLIADPNPALWQELSHALSPWLPDEQFGCCATRDEALDRVVNPAYFYDVVISSAGFAESELGFLLNGLKCRSVPLVITTGVSTLAASRRVLEAGAFGLIRVPVDGKRAAKTLLMATRLKDLHRRTTVYYDLVKNYYERLDACPQDHELEELLRQCHVVLESTYDMWRATIRQIEQSVQRLARAALTLEDEARLQAYAQLCELEIMKSML